MLRFSFVARIKSRIWPLGTFWKVLNGLRDFRVVGQLWV